MSKPWEYSTNICESILCEYPCPIEDSSIHSSDKPIRWIHSNCGGNFRLYSNGKEKCQKCGVECLFCNQNYSCSDSNKFNSHKIRAILQYLVGISDDNVSDDFWFDIKASLSWQKREFPSKFD